MEEQISKQEAEAILRRLERRSKAESVLARPAKHKPLSLACIIAASLFAQYSLRGFAGPDLTAALIVGGFVGLVAMGVELWSVRRRLEAIVELMQVRDREQT